jgi:hypothetical protein
MGSTNSLDIVNNIITSLICDVQQRHGSVFDTHSLNLTLKKVKKRLQSEGMCFLTKTLPRLGKAFDKALSGHCVLNSVEHGFKPMPNSKLPKFLGELFRHVLSDRGELLPNPDASCVESIRQILFVFYKYELPFTDEQVQQVVSKFEETERQLATTEHLLDQLDQEITAHTSSHRRTHESSTLVEVTREARALLHRVFASFDCRDIVPRHGPGAVATRQKLWSKFEFTNVSSRITDVYALDEYFYSSLTHVSDRLDSLMSMRDEDLPARVCLVPKDSRGPRLISCEPVDFQWIQQGLGRAIVDHVENIELTKFNVFFTDQGPNQRGAWLGSKTGRYATLDLNEASDRVSLSLVRLLFPTGVLPYLEACRSTSTELPGGKILPLKKYAPMGSCLCFPVLALTVWAILTAGAPDADTREGILVYGDDIVVPTAYAVNAMKLLESYGLKVNQDKSCTKGLFRESCGTDAFQGVNVTPVRLRTVWESSPSPEVYTSWIAYANHFYDRRYHRTYDYIVGLLLDTYREVPSDDMYLTCPSLRYVPERGRPKKQRFNKDLQKIQVKAYAISNRTISKEIDGWSMLLRYFTEGSQAPAPSHMVKPRREDPRLELSKFERPLSVRQYTKRKTSMLVKRWL